VLPFDPGLAIPTKSGVSVMVGGSVQTEACIDGYSVPSGQVPTAALDVSGKAGGARVPQHP
jgi:hypothetical protein